MWTVETGAPTFRKKLKVTINGETIYGRTANKFEAVVAKRTGWASMVKRPEEQ